MAEDIWAEDVAVHREHDMRIFFNYGQYEFTLLKSLLADFSTGQFTFAIDRLDAFHGVLTEILSDDKYGYVGPIRAAVLLVNLNGDTV
jgi:hypothetical protein